tara:strand:+ start:427 stop:837 length:411 start_codon:yes stop_codon:yes gene_type:complete
VKVEALHTGLVTEQDQEHNPSMGGKDAAAMSAFQKKIIDEPSDDEYSDDTDQVSKKQSPERKPFDLGAEEEDGNGSEDKDVDEDEEYSDDNENEHHNEEENNSQPKQVDENEKEPTTSEQEYSNDDDFDETENKTS